MKISISALSIAYGLTPEALRYYEEKGLLSPDRAASSGFRRFSIADVQRLGIIKSLQRQGFSLDEIKRILTKCALSDLIVMMDEKRAALREQIALLYNDNPEVVALASHLMLLAAVYQISDSIQVIGSGVLRGYKDTRSIFFITFIAYWVLGLPCGYILALTDLVVDRMGPAGFWMGFILGLTSAAIMMMMRMRFLQRQPSTVILQRAAR